GIFIVSRFIIAAFYASIPDVGFEPMVTIIVPCRNEADAIAKTIMRIYAEGYPHHKLEVIVVNDASTDTTLDEMRRVQSCFPSLVIVDFEKNRGLAQGMAVCTLLARGEILIFVDSDTFIRPGSVRKICQGMADPRVGGVSGHTDVENVDTNILTRMQDVRYYVSFKVMKAAESMFAAVSCLPGCFSAYRKICVLNALDHWLNRKFLGVYGAFGDDRSLTNLVLRDYRILYDDEALATTLVPDQWNKYIRQQARWTRSWVREIFTAGTFMWRKHPAAAIAWYAMMFLPILEPVVMVQALILGPLIFGQMTSYYIIGVSAITTVWSLYYLEKTGRKSWWTGIVFTLTYVLFFSWQVYYALATMRRPQWGTRG
ncbi:MAG: glycosyltransferase, partial [Lentisphaerae bacterium]|nr:glycosyltransferase [Lentisphaerota bacterium]